MRRVRVCELVKSFRTSYFERTDKMQNDSRKSWRKRSSARMNNCLHWVFGKSDDEDNSNCNVIKVQPEEDRSENKRSRFAKPAWMKTFQSSSTTKTTSIRYLTKSAQNSKNSPKNDMNTYNHPETSTSNKPSTSMVPPRSLPKDLLQQLNRSSPIKSLSSQSSERPAGNSKNLLKCTHAPIQAEASTSKEPSTSKTHRTFLKLKEIIHKYGNSLPVKSSGFQLLERPASEYSKTLPKNTNDRSYFEPSTSKEPSTLMAYPMFPQEIIRELKTSSPTKSLSCQSSAWSAENLKNRSMSTNNLFHPEASTSKESSTLSIPQKVANLEEIIQEFEIASCTSATGRSLEKNAKQQKFVKKIVEAMEEKYSTYNITKEGRKEKRRKLAEEEEKMEASNIVENSKNNNPSMEISIEPDVKNEAEEFKEEEEKMEVKVTSKVEKKRTIPKIVGAFLKRPIEVEETSINWIPLPRNILPRKKSLKKLMNMLPRRKIRPKPNSMTFVCPSQKNLKKSPTPTYKTMRGTPDSGFDDKLSSFSFSSSNSSLTSISEALMQQRDIQEDPRKMMGRALTTFKPNDNDPWPEDTAERNSAYSPSKLLLKEVPRLELPIESVPICIPKPSKVTASLDRRPMTFHKASFLQQSYFGSVPRYRSKSQSSRSNPRSILQSDSANKGECSSHFSLIPVYDIPRPHISLSESHLHELPKYRRTNDEEHVYDQPRLRPRPSSSLFEEAQSVKRRNECLELFLDFDILSETRRDECYIVENRYIAMKGMSKQLTLMDNLDDNDVEMNIEMWNMLKSDGFYRFPTMLHR